jgi:formate hydrogenlyase transcriptional activator
MMKDNCGSLSSIGSKDILLAMRSAEFADQKAEALRDQYQTLLEVTESIASHRDLSELFHDLAQPLRNVLHFDYLSVRLHDPERKVMRLHILEKSAPGELVRELPVDESLAGFVWQTQQALLIDDIEHDVRFPRAMQRLRENHIKSCCCLPLSTAHRRLGAITLGSVREKAYQPTNFRFLEQVARQVAVAIDNALNFEQAQSLQKQFKVERDHLSLLLEVNNALVSTLNLGELLKAVSASLRRLVPHEYASLSLYEPKTGCLQVHALDFPVDNRLYDECLSVPVEDTPTGLAYSSRKPVVLNREGLERLSSDVCRLLLAKKVQSVCCLPLISHNRALGALNLASLQENAFGPEVVQLLNEVASQVAIAVENALNFEQTQSVQQQLKEEHDRLRLLLDVNNTVVSTLDLRELLNAVSASLRRLVPHEYASLSLYDAETQRLQIHALDFPASKGLIQEGLWIPVEGTPHGRALTLRQPLFVTLQEIEEFELTPRIRAEGLKSGCFLPLISHGRPLGTIVVASLQAETFPQKDADLLQHVANQIAIAVENALSYRQVVDRANKLREEKLYLQDEIRTEYNFEEIIGESAALKKVLEQIQTVAPTDSTILILGETGTGKELIARAIHNLSARGERTLVKVNCAAIPTGLLESELFGHEKGAFTGAIGQRVGRFELAHRGTLFLDEVGDIPLELQPKLLRVLQEQEFERLGSARTIRVDVRLVAATNTDLSGKVEEKQFRQDLYYRLNVFPITIPPLRDRKEDIPLLVRYFAQKYARRMKKPIDAIPAKAMTALTEYHWPGNVRELENFIERAVILSRGAELKFPLAEFKQRTNFTPAPALSAFATLEHAEREHIVRALGESHWVIGGPAGAAARLGLKRTTLQSRMRKLGITRSDYV